MWRASSLSDREEFFFEKKNQKTFFSLRACWGVFVFLEGGLAVLLCGVAPRASLAASDAHMLCSAFGHAVTTAAAGPNGASAALAMQSHDDFAKDSHECEVDYAIILTPDKVPRIGHADVPFRSDNVWGRELELRIDGFSASGDRILGAIYESAKPPPEWDGERETGRLPRKPANFLLSFDRQRHLTLFDASEALSQLQHIKCGKSFRVIGTIGAAGVVAAPNTNDPCGKNFRWSIAAPDAPLAALAPGAKFTPLYQTNAVPAPPL